MLSCLWDGAYKRNIAANKKEQQTNTGTLTELPAFIRMYIYTIGIEFPLGCHATATRVMPFSGLNGQPRETPQHLHGPI